MIFLFGIRSQIKPLGNITTCACPACGRSAPLKVIYKYMTPHVFFIPTFRFHREYVAVCGGCASVMALRNEKGRELLQNPAAQISPEDLIILKNHAKL